MAPSGYVIEDLGVAVDFWHVVNKPHVRFFFLTHGHSDHIEGLTSTWKFPIYCSPTTAKVVSEIKGVQIDVFRQLELNKINIIFDENGDYFMDVILIDADHCPGAVMFIMKGEFGRILCTGDFRYETAKQPTSPNKAPRYVSLKKSKINFDILKRAPFDRIYLDTTNWKFGERLLPRKDVTAQIIELIETHNDCQFLIAVPQLVLGREDLLVEIAQHFKTYVSVSLNRMKILEILNVPNVFSTGHLDTAQIRLVPLAKARTEFQKMLSFPDCNPFLIVPTSVAAKLKFDFHENVRCIYYSDHCDRFEIESFLKELNVRKIIGVPLALTSDECRPFLSGVPPKKFVPQQQMRKHRLRHKLNVDRTRTRKRRKPTGFEYAENQTNAVQIMEVSESSSPQKTIVTKHTECWTTKRVSEESMSSNGSAKRRHHLFDEEADINLLSVPANEPSNDKGDRKKTFLPLTHRRCVRDIIKDFQVTEKEFNVFECIINGNSGLVCEDPEIRAIAEKFANENVKTFFSS